MSDTPTQAAAPAGEDEGHGLPGLRHDCDPSNLFGCGADGLLLLPGLVAMGTTSLAGARTWVAAWWLFVPGLAALAIAGMMDQAKTSSFAPSRWGLIWAVALTTGVWSLLYGHSHLALVMLGVGLVTALLREWSATRGRAASMRRWGLDAEALHAVVALPETLPDAVAEPLRRGVAAWELLLGEASLLPDAAGFVADGQRTLAAMCRSAAAASSGETNGPDLAKVEQLAGLLVTARESCRQYAATLDGDQPLAARLADLDATTTSLRDLDSELGSGT